VSRAVRLRVPVRVAGLLALGAAVIAPATASAERLGGRTLRPGSEGSDVRALQHALSQTGFGVRATGRFDAATTRQVRNFERRYHLTVDGIASASFVKTLRLVRRLDLATVGADSGSGGGGLTGVDPTAPTTPTTPTTPTAPTTGTTTTTVVKSKLYGKRVLHKGMKGSDVKALQSYLSLAGFPTGIDGQFGPATRRSVVAWEEANGIVPANGVLSTATEAQLKQDVTTAVVSTTTAAQATLNTDGTVTPPPDAPAQVVEAIAAANSIIDTPYIYGGGHGSFTDRGYDCSGAVSFALHGGGLLDTPEDSSELESFGDAGPGQWISVYSDPAHAFVVIAGLAFDTAHYGKTFPAGSGPRWLPASDVLSNLSDGGDYVVRHPDGL
jgi:peptidoglycan hydrolase-like protein with peptidoglycan-binding domain